jgi:hypothetical protein
MRRYCYLQSTAAALRRAGFHNVRIFTPGSRFYIQAILSFEPYMIVIPWDVRAIVAFAPPFLSQ